MIQYQTYLDAWKKRVKEREEARTDLRLRALAAAERAACRIGREFDVRRVILYGSLVHEPDRFYEESDIDLAVEGLEPGDFFAAWQLAETAAGGFPVDLTLLEEAKPWLKERIMAEGRVLYDIAGCPPYRPAGGRDQADPE
ncbi:MAG: nucleotidyltransferase family protein [Bacillota bacterium]